jgi:hypothetical protein
MRRTASLLALAALLAGPAAAQPTVAGIAARAFPVQVTVAQLPAAGSGSHGMRIVTNGASASDCTAGGGSTVVVCVDTGASWVASGSSGSVTLAGDVDGDSGSNDLDEAAVETELEAVLDLSDLQGAVTDAQVPDSITVTLAATATALAANPTDCDVDEFATAIDASGNLTCAAGGAGGIGGTVGATDNAIPRADGTGADTVQASSLLISDTHVLQFECATSSCPGLGRRSATDRLLVVKADFSAFTDIAAGSFQAPDDTAPAARVEAAGLRFGSTRGVVWQDNVSASSGSDDTGVFRHAAGMVMPTAGMTGIGFFVHPPTDTPPTCNDANRGAVYFDDSLGEHCACKGATGAASWQEMDGGGAC